MKNTLQRQTASANRLGGSSTARGMTGMKNSAWGLVLLALTLALGACSPAAPAPVPAPVAPVTGTLQVNISGLPAGVAANVVVSGPDSFSQVLTQTTALNKLISGTYTFTINAVKPDSATFSDTGSPASLKFEASVGGSIALNYGCSSVKAPDATVDKIFQLDTRKADYTCADLAQLKRFEASPSFAAIADLEGLQYATGLTFLDLSFNRLSSLPAGIFDRLSNLQELILHNNRRSSQISTLPTGIFDKLTNLTRLDLSGNNIETLPPGIFDRLSKLTQLNLSNNGLKTLPDGFANLAALEQLELASNSLSALPASLVVKLPTLKGLSIHTNCFATQQNPIKAALATFKAQPLIADESPQQLGCPQKTITLSSLKAQLLSDNRTDPSQTDTVFLKISIDGVDQGDFGVGEKTLHPQETLSINKTLFVNTALKIEIFAKGSPNKSIGEAVLPIDADYAPGVNKFSLLGSGSVYVLTLDQQ